MRVENGRTPLSKRVVPIVLTAPVRGRVAVRLGEFDVDIDGHLVLPGSLGPDRARCRFDP